MAYTFHLAHGLAPNPACLEAPPERRRRERRKCPGSGVKRLVKKLFHGDIMGMMMIGIIYIYAYVNIYIYVCVYV